MTLNEQVETRTAWDRIAAGYDRTNTPTQMWLGKQRHLRNSRNSFVMWRRLSVSS